MNPIIKNKLSEVAELCVKRQVRRLELFGSAAREDFEQGRSDLDLLVEFLPMTPAQRANNFFGLMADLKQLLGTEIDLLEPEPIRNPYFKQAIEQNKVVLYEAA